MERIRFFNIIFYRVIISRSLETDRKFTKVCSTKSLISVNHLSVKLISSITIIIIIKKEGENRSRV